MSFEVETPSDTQAKVRIRVPRQDVDAAISHELGHLQERARIPGFRPGKVPKQVLQKRFGDSVVKEVRRRLVAEAFEEGLSERKIHPVSSPRLEESDLEPKEDGSLAVDFDLEVIPHVEPTGYDKFSITPPPIDLNEGDVDREIEALRRQAAKFDEVADGLAAAGDVVIADLKLQFLDGSELPPLENRIVDTGAGLVDGVECEDAKTKFTGSRRGDVVKVSMKLPEQFPDEAHRGKTAVTQCTVKDLRRMSLPEADAPEFLAQLGVKDAGELRSRVSDRLQRMLRSEQDRVVEEMCIDALLDKNRVELPPAYLQRTIEAERERMRRDLGERGVAPEQIERHILENEGQLKNGIERRLRATFLLDRIAEKLGVEVSSQELEQQFVLMGQAWRVEPQKLFDEFHEKGLVPSVVQDIRRGKVRRRLRETAAATENDAGTDSTQTKSENAS